MKEDGLPPVVMWGGILYTPVARFDEPAYLLENPLTGQRTARAVSVCKDADPNEALATLASALKERNSIVRDED